MRLQVRHQTSYHYSSPVSLAVNHACVTPRDTAQQRCVSSRLMLSPEPASIDILPDAFGNAIHRFSFERPHMECSIIAMSVVETRDPQGTLDYSPHIQDLPGFLGARLDDDGLMASDCLLSSPFVPVDGAVDALIERIRLEQATVLGFAAALMHEIYRSFTYDPEFSTLVTPISEVVEQRRGVCQDFAHLAIAALRRTGIPARYVSGYLETLPPPGAKKLQGSDASHAWYSVYAPGIGWVDFDPTNNKRPDSQYVTTAWGRDYSDVAPLEGVMFGGGEATLEVAVDVDRIG